MNPEIIISNSDNKMVKVKDLKESLTCGICRDILNEPFTIPCNHTFCYVCLAGTNENAWELSRECPICKKKYCLPPQGKVNFVIKDIIVKLTSEKAYNKTKNANEKQGLKYSLRNQVINELRSEYYNSIVDNVDFNILAENQMFAITEPPSSGTTTMLKTGAIFASGAVAAAICSKFIPLLLKRV